MPKREMLAAGRGSARGVPLRRQGAAAHHSLEAAGRRRATTRAIFLAQLDALGRHARPVLFQLPPYLKRDPADRLAGFLPWSPRRRAPDRLRVPSRELERPAVGEAIVGAGCTVCAATPTRRTRDRPRRALRLPAPAQDRLRRRALRRLGGSRPRPGVGARRSFFKHEDEGRGPQLARRFLDLC
jgi:uncharacterized protein YecE (DUF72 family)